MSARKKRRPKHGSSTRVPEYDRSGPFCNCPVRYHGHMRGIPGCTDTPEGLKRTDRRAT